MADVAVSLNSIEDAEANNLLARFFVIKPFLLWKHILNLNTTLFNHLQKRNC